MENMLNALAKTITWYASLVNLIAGTKMEINSRLIQYEAKIADLESQNLRGEVRAQEIDRLINEALNLNKGDVETAGSRVTPFADFKMPEQALDRLLRTPVPLPTKPVSPLGPSRRRRLKRPDRPRRQLRATRQCRTSEVQKADQTSANHHQQSRNLHQQTLRPKPRAPKVNQTLASRQRQSCNQRQQTLRPKPRAPKVNQTLATYQP